MQPTTFETGTIEYKRLVAVAKMLEALSANDATYEVEDVYFDYGQEWMWTTICRKGFKECQVLTPREWELIISSQTTGALANTCDEIINSKYFGDK